MQTSTSIPGGTDMVMATAMAGEKRKRKEGTGANIATTLLASLWVGHCCACSHLQFTSLEPSLAVGSPTTRSLTWLPPYQPLRTYKCVSRTVPSCSCQQPHRPFQLCLLCHSQHQLLLPQWLA